VTRRRPRVASGAAGDERPTTLAAINTNGDDGTAAAGTRRRGGALQEVVLLSKCCHGVGGELRHAIPPRHNRPNSQKRLRARRRRRHGNHRVRVAIWRHGETLTNGQNLVLRRAWPAVWDCRARRGSRGTCAPPLGLGGRTTGLSRRRVRGYRRCEGGRYGLSVRVCCGLPYVVRYARARSTILLLRS
jgi:hypothetical protein